MPGPSVHNSALECLEVIGTSYLGESWGVVTGNLYSMIPDSGPSHGGDVPNNNYHILDMTIDQMNVLIGHLRDGLYWQNVNHVQKCVNYICHYCVDMLTVGQIDARLWGSNGDDKFDMCADLVSDKKKDLNSYLTLSPSVVQTEETLYNAIRHQVWDTDRIYWHDAMNWKQAWWYPLIPGTAPLMANAETNMIRRAVVKGARNAAFFIWYAYIMKDS